MDGPENARRNGLIPVTGLINRSSTQTADGLPRPIEAKGTKMRAPGKRVSDGIVSCERGATAIEYGLIAALIALAAVTALGATGSSLSNVFTAASNGMG